MAAEQEAHDVVVKEVHTFNFPSSDRLSRTAVEVCFNEENRFKWQGTVRVKEPFFEIQFYGNQIYGNGQSTTSHYYLLLENRDRKEASCVFHGVISSQHRWDPSKSETEPRPTMDAIFDPANGYVNEANQLTFKVLFEVNIGTGPTYRWTILDKHTQNPSIVSCNQVPLQILRPPHRNALGEAMQHMFQNNTLTDVIIEIEGGKNIKAHKVILIAMSIVFQKALEGEFKEAKTKKLSITDFPGQAVEEFVRYLYYQELSPAVLEEHSADLWGLPDKYEVEVLQKHVVELRPRFVTEANVINLLMRADIHGAKDIQDYCLRYMARHSKSIARQEEALRALPQHILADYIVAYRQ